MIKLLTLGALIFGSLSVYSQTVGLADQKNWSVFQVNYFAILVLFIALFALGFAFKKIKKLAK